MLYLDNNATTAPAPEVIEAMLPYWREHWGNPSSLHALGRAAAPALDRAREQVAALLGAERASEICFTSGGTEGDNAALRGLAAAQPNKRHLITTAVEHNAVLHCCQTMAAQGYELTILPVERDGRLDVGRLEQAIRPDTALVAAMWANNETGVCFPLEAIAQCTAARGVPLHVDAVQIVGKLPIAIRDLPLTTCAISAHKFHGPKGIGALYVRRGTPFRPFIVGGSQEFGRRAGTEPVPQIAGLGVASELATGCARDHRAAIAARRDRLETALLERVPDCHINGARESRVPNTTNLSFTGVDGEGLLFALSQAGLCASTGSACSAGSTEPSHVLVAMHLSPTDLKGTLRLSLSRYTTDAEIDQAIELIPRIVADRRALSLR